MADPTPTPARGWPIRLAVGSIVLVSVAAAAGFYWLAHHKTEQPARAEDPKPPTGAKPPAVGGRPLFADWPGGQSPELVLVLSGQTYGYLSPCGCSRPQKGGLERRANFIDGLKAKGWAAVGLDLGDIAPAKGPLGLHSHKQNLLKYKTTLYALRDMGYAAVGLGEYDFAAQLYDLLSQYTLNNAGKPPFVLAGNLARVKERNAAGEPVKLFTREESFPGDAKPMVGGYEVVASPGKPAVAVVGVVGKEVMDKVEKLDKEFGFLNNQVYLASVQAELDKHPAKPALRVLLYAGKLDLAKQVAQAFPQFQLILCQSDDPEPPQFPTLANDGQTLIAQVGHKGQHVGAVGVFKKPDGGFELKYQLVPLGEEYLTPEDPAAEKNNKVLQLLEQYADEVKRQNLLAEYTRNRPQHKDQIQHPGANLSFVGSQACAACHPAEYKAYQGTKHSHAYDALVGAKRPGNRQFDGECIVCHTVGFEWQTGYETAEKTPNLKNVGCESCHGPGSGHAANPKNAQFLQQMTWYKAKPEDKLPDLAFLKKMAETKPIDRGQVKMPANQIQLVNTVSSWCMRCHDPENDPKFDFYEYMPKVYHSGLKTDGLPPGAK